MKHYSRARTIPEAQAACSAFATGIYYALQGKTPLSITYAMIHEARKFDQETKRLNTKIELLDSTALFSDPDKYDQDAQLCRNYLQQDKLTTADMLEADSSPKAQQTWRGLQTAVWTVGGSDSLATLAGALLGVYSGFTPSDSADNTALNSLENYPKLQAMGTYLYELIAGTADTTVPLDALFITPLFVYDTDAKELKKKI